MNHGVVPLVICWVNKRVPKRLKGATQQAKSLQSNTVTSLEMLPSQHCYLRLHKVIFAPFSLDFFSRNMGCGTFC